MKIKIMWHLFILISALIYTPSISWAETTQVKGDALRKEYRKAIEQKRQLENDLENLQKKYDEALEKVRRKGGKPSSRSYKRALKYEKKYKTKIEEISNKIISLSNKIDSIENIVNPPKDTIHYEQESIETTLGMYYSTTIPNDDNEIVIPTEIQNSPQETEYDFEERYIPIEEDSSSNPLNANDNQEKQSQDTKEKEEEEGLSIFSLFLFIGFIAAIGFLVSESKRCPNCGKKSLKFVSGCYSWNEQQKRVFKKTYICQECGYKKIRFENVITNPKH